MKNSGKYFEMPQKSDWIIIISYWVLSSFLLLPAYFNQTTAARAFVALAYNIIIDTTFIFILIYVVLPFSLKNKNFWMPIVSIIILLFLSSFFYRFGYGFILKKPLDWSFLNIIGLVIRQAQSLGILLSILAMKKFYSSQQNILSLEKANAESNLKVLSNQIAPHFLFNNLNVLQSLIQTDAHQATQFVKHLSSIYRYLIRHKDEEVVTLREEMAFVADYIYLLNQRFGQAFVFTKEIENDQAFDKLVPSCSLQILLENIVKHNQGNEQKPLQTVILVTENFIQIQNEIREKIAQNEFSGTGLQNLNQRYQLLSNQSIVIEVTENFTVKLPLINQLKSY